MTKFALPAIASMVVNSIYNIVDQIFIGQGVGMFGNAATNLTFPFVTFSMAIGTMIADGCVAYFSLKLGEKNYREAEKAMGNGISIALLAGLLLTLLMEVFIDGVLLLCGGPPYLHLRKTICVDCAYRYPVCLHKHDYKQHYPCPRQPEIRYVL